MNFLEFFSLHVVAFLSDLVTDATNIWIMIVLFGITRQSRAHPREIMTEVLKALRELNVAWKKIGHYNMKCRWLPGIPGHHEGMINNPVHSNHYFGDESTIIENDGVVKSPNVIKFEVQVFFFLLGHLKEMYHITLFHLLALIEMHFIFFNINFRSFLNPLCLFRLRPLINTFPKLDLFSTCFINELLQFHV